MPIPFNVAYFAFSNWVPWENKFQICFHFGVFKSVSGLFYSIPGSFQINIFCFFLICGGYVEWAPLCFLLCSNNDLFYTHRVAHIYSREMPKPATVLFGWLLSSCNRAVGGAALCSKAPRKLELRKGEIVTHSCLPCPHFPNWSWD